MRIVRVMEVMSMMRKVKIETIKKKEVPLKVRADISSKEEKMINKTNSMDSLDKFNKTYLRLACKMGKLYPHSFLISSLILIFKHR